MGLGFPQHGELAFALFDGELPCLKILSAQQGVHVLEASPSKAEGHADPQKLVGIGAQMVVEG